MLNWAKFPTTNMTTTCSLRNANRWATTWKIKTVLRTNTDCQVAASSWNRSGMIPRTDTTAQLWPGKLRSDCQSGTQHFLPLSVQCELLSAVWNYFLNTFVLQHWILVVLYNKEAALIAHDRVRIPPPTGRWTIQPQLRPQPRGQNTIYNDSDYCSCCFPLTQTLSFFLILHCEHKPECGDSIWAHEGNGLLTR